jgi:hypothetical protein
MAVVATSVAFGIQVTEVATMHSYELPLFSRAPYLNTGTKREIHM